MVKQVGPKSSASQLWGALQAERQTSERWRRVATSDAPKTGVRPDEVVLPKSDLDGLTRELETERARARARDSELADARMAAAESGVAGVKFAGKPALSDVNAAFKHLADAIFDLPNVTHGLPAGLARLVAARELDPDLYLLGLTSPRNRDEARDRKWVRRWLNSPVRFAKLCDPRNRRTREMVVKLAARCYLPTSYSIIYEKAAEQGILDDGLGVVYK